MKLKIHEKWFEVKDDDMTIKVENEEDLKMFEEWSRMSTSGIPKMEYVKDLEWKSATRYGWIHNCFPVLNIFTSEVKIHFDYFSSNYKHINL